MSAHDEIRATQRDLREAVASGTLSEPLQKRAEQMLRRIESPVRLGLMGLPGSGKSALMNLLLGENILPEGARLPTLSLTHGETAQAICTMNDGTKQIVDGDDFAALSELGAAFIEARLPVPALAKLSMLELVAGSKPVDQQRAVQWASKRVDVALWCTTTAFGEAEQDIWDYMSEAVQDHSFLLLTKADDPTASKDVAARMAEATSNGQDFFKQILPVGTKTALAARKSDGSVDKDAMRGAGAIALISAILREVEAGRQGALDQAEVFLRQIDFTSTAVDIAEPSASAQPVVKTEVSATQEAPEVVEPPVAETQTADVISLTEHSKHVVAQAVEQLTAEGEVMLQSFSEGNLTDEAVIETCVDTVSWLADYLSDSADENDPAFEICRDVALDAADLAQLIQLEKSDTVAADVLTLMVQLKQDMQTSLAA